MRALLAVALTMLASKPAEACSVDCERTFSLASPRPDAGEVPTNVQLLATVPILNVGSPVGNLRLERTDGGDGESGIPLDGVVLGGNGCGSELMRLRPLRALAPDTDYRFHVAADAGIDLMALGAVTFVFRTGAGPDSSPPSWPVLDELRLEDANCSSCGKTGGGASVSFKPSEAVWFMPIEAKYRTSGGPNGFFVRFACGGVSPGLDEGVHQMPVIAFDSAWNQSEVSYVDLETNCTGIDPCTGERASQNDSAAPLRGASGCGCSSSPTLLSLLSAAAFARVLSRRRGWSSSSTSGCWRWGRSASSSSRSRR